MKKMLCVMMALLMLCGCNTVIGNEDTSSTTAVADNTNYTEGGADASYEISGSTYISLGNEDVKINKAGTYILEGTLNGSVIVEVSDSEDVQLVLNNVTINSADFAGIYIVEGDEITITLAEGSVNTISDSSAYTQIDSNEVDALIYSKADLFINGEGSLVLNSAYNHGIVSKDDLVVTSGNFAIDVAGAGMKGKDCLIISDGTYVIRSGKDGLKSDNDEDAERGYITISGGSFEITSVGDGIYGLNAVNIEDGTFKITTSTSSSDSAKAIKSDLSVTISGGEFTIDSCDDGIHSDQDVLIKGGNFNIVSDDDAIHGDSKVQIDAGDFTINAHEGIEATYVLLNGGNIDITATDDGINAGQKVNTYTATIEINDGTIKIDMGQGDTDAVDSNGYIYINGGTLEINAQSPFDYDMGAELNGGTVIVNGSEVNSISNQMMGGFGGMGMHQMPGGMNQENNEYNEGPGYQEGQSGSYGPFGGKPGRH